VCFFLLNGDVQIVESSETAGAGNAGRGMVEFTSNNQELVYSKRGCKFHMIPLQEKALLLMDVPILVKMLIFKGLRFRCQFKRFFIKVVLIFQI